MKLVSEIFFGATSDVPSKKSLECSLFFVFVFLFGYVADILAPGNFAVCCNSQVFNLVCNLECVTRDGVVSFGEFPSVGYKNN